jgi:cell wall-associated NlpC family hydrolase
MRHIGDLRWLNSYIGIPYVFGGRDMKGADCYGLCRLVYQAQYGIQLPDWSIDQDDLSTLDNLITGALTSGDWRDLDEPVDGCFVVCANKRAAHHMGLYYGGGVLHTVRGFSSTYQPMNRFSASFTNIVFGEWTP